MIALFAWFGALRIPTALLLLVIGLRYRTLVLLGLLWVILARGLMTYDVWFGKASNNRHHPPERFASQVTAELAMVFLLLSLRSSRAVSQV